MQYGHPDPWLGGQERTNAEYGRLLADAGLVLRDIHAVAAPYGIIEGVVP